MSANISPWLLHTGPLSWLTTSTLGVDGRRAVAQHPVLYTARWHAGGPWKSVLEAHTTPHHTTPHHITPHHTTPHHTTPQLVSCLDTSVTFVRKCKAHLFFFSFPFFFFFWQMCSRRRYDPAAICLLSSSAPSLLTAKLRERREGSHLRASPVCCCCRNQDILPAPHRNSRDFFPSRWLCPLLLLKVVSLLVALSPPGCGWLFLHEDFPKCVSVVGKRDSTSVMHIPACWHTFRRATVCRGSRSAGPML